MPCSRYRPFDGIKYEEVYLKAYDCVSAAKASLGNYIEFYNTRRPHQSFGGKTPDMIYFAGLQRGAPLISVEILSKQTGPALYTPAASRNKSAFVI